MNGLNTKAVIASVVSNDTGEVINQIYEGDYIGRSKDDDGYVHNFNEGRPFVKLYLEVNKLRKELTPGEFQIAMSLADFICYEDCILREGGRLNGKILSLMDLSEKMDMNYEALRKQMNSLMKKGVIGIHKTGIGDENRQICKAITVNPYIYSKGCKINKTIESFYSDTKWTINSKSIEKT